MKPVIDSAAPLWKDDINYPGVPPMPDRPLAAKVTNRATVDYGTYVLAYTTRVVVYALLSAFGAAGALGAVVILSGAAMVIMAALSIGAVLAGGVGVIVITEAHRTYTRHLAVATTETYHERPAAQPAPQPPTARPIVASANGNPRTTRTGRLHFEPTVWRDLFDRALRNNGVVTRDGALSARADELAAEVERLTAENAALRGELSKWRDANATLRAQLDAAQQAMRTQAAQAAYYGCPHCGAAIELPAPPQE